MEFLAQKYEHITKCKPHIDQAKTVCTHPFCLGRFLCSKCFQSHPLEHRKGFITIEDFFTCTIQSKFDEEVQRELNIEMKIKKEVNEMLTTIDSLFSEFKAKFLTKLNEIKDKLKEEISKPLQETRLDTKHWTLLREKLATSYADFSRVGLLDEVAFYNYISAYEKALNKVTEVDPDHRNASEELLKSDKKCLKISYQPLQDIFQTFNKILEDFSANGSLKPDQLYVKKKSSMRKKASSTARYRFSQRIIDSSPEKEQRASRKVSDTNVSTVTAPDLPKFFVVRRVSQNYPLDQNLLRDLSSIKGTKKEEKPQGTLKHAYRLDNLKSFNTEHEGIISSTIFIEKLNLIVTGGKEGKIKFWDALTLQLKRTFDAHKGKIYSLKYIPKRNMLVSASQDYLIKVFKLDTESYKMWTLLGHFGPVTALEYAHDLDNIISGGSNKDKTIKIWRVDHLDLEFEFLNLPSGVNSLLYIESLCLLAAGLSQGKVHLYDMEKKTLRDIIDVYSNEHPKDFINIAFENSSKTVVDTDHRDNYPKDIVSLACDEEKKHIYCGGIDGVFSIWSLTHYSKSLVKKFTNNLSWARFLFLPKKEIVLIVSKEKSVRIINISNMKASFILDVVEGNGSILSFIPKNQVFVTDLNSGVVKIWTLTKEKISE